MHRRASIQSITVRRRAYVGTFRPKNPSAASTTGEDPTGVVDARRSPISKSTDTGTLRRFSLRITHPVCNAPTPYPGEAAAAPRWATRSGVTESAGQLTAIVGASCRPTGADYAVYQGRSEAGTATSRSSARPGARRRRASPRRQGDVCFLVVPQSAESEGSYGRAQVREREDPAGAGARAGPQLLSACP